MSQTLTETLPSEDEALSAIAFAIENSEAEAISVTLVGKDISLARFSENQISQNIQKKTLGIEITSHFGQRRASAATSLLDQESILQTLRRSQDLASIAPIDPEWVPLLPPQTYESRLPAFDQETASISPLARGEKLKEVCLRCQNSGIEGSGTLKTGATVKAIGNSLGLSAFNRTTEADFSVTARLDSGSSWNRRTAWNIDDIPLNSITEAVIDQGKRSCSPKTVEPSTYPVIFSPAAFADLLNWVIWNMDARAADEGRSFMAAETSQGNRLGENLFSPLVKVERNAAHPLLQSGTFCADGLPNSSLDIIQDGIPKTLSYSRYWAKETGQMPTGSLSPIVMPGSTAPLSELIASINQGVLVSRAWYVRYTNPRTLEVTGMTRDGTFWIEDGKIAYPIKNMRFNQCLPEMMRDITAVSEVARVGTTVVPGVCVKAFNFSSITDSI